MCGDTLMTLNSTSLSFTQFLHKDLPGTMEKIDILRREIAKREVELADLRSQLAVAESEAREGKEAWKWPLDNHEYERYSRQMIVPSFGLQGKNPVNILFYFWFIVLIV